MPTRTEWFKLRLNPRELDEWREAARLAREPLSAYVRRSVATTIGLETALRKRAEQEARLREMQRRAAEKLLASQT